jgi:hypothetical protein
MLGLFYCFLVHGYIYMRIRYFTLYNVDIKYISIKISNNLISKNKFRRTQTWQNQIC